MESEPLVSVGIPCYNRSEGLRRTLECITGQTYKNLEIIVSDNCSPNPDVEKVGREFADKDKRVCYVKQSENLGAWRNFQFVLDKASGEYFMWAADDDIWKSYFIEKCLSGFQNSDKKYVAVTMEAQYFSENGLFEYFEEGIPFYEFYSENIKDRIEYILKYNYGNLIYSLFKRDALYENGCSIWDIGNMEGLNENPLFLIVMKNGNWKVIPQIGFLKKTNNRTYDEAKWEKKGGPLPNSSGPLYYKRLPSIAKYHWTALKDMEKIISVLNIGAYNSHVKMLARKSISKHFYFLLIRHKPPLF